jgi:catechol 2,3-dioxygenase-like lactoylglutathione lyase family enzyme
MITSTNHLSFTVSDLDVSIDFYETLLGLKIDDISPRPKKFSEDVTGVIGAELRVAYVYAHNVKVELIQYISPAGKKLDTTVCNVGSSHICFNVDAFDAMVKRLIDAGTTVGKVCTVPAGPNTGKKVVYIEDPDSNTIELISNDN